MTLAIEKFRELERGVLALVRASDVYAIHIMAKLRGQDVSIESIEAILNGTKMSGFNFIGGMYTSGELKKLEVEGHFREIGQQIIVATHTALEAYLTLKFREYYRFLMGSSERELLEKTVSEFKFRQLSDFTKMFYRYFSIHLPSFEVDITSSVGCNFMPKSSWEGINLIDDARHDIVHKGSPSKYNVSSLMDSWYPFEFVERWVSTFDAVFDSYIYDHLKTSLYLEHIERAKTSHDSI